MRSFAQIRTAHKLLIGTGICLLVTIFLSVLLMLQIQQLRGIAHVMATDPLPGTALIARMTSDIKGYRLKEYTMLLGGLALRFHHAVERPIARLSAIVHAVAGGDLDIRVPVQGRLAVQSIVRDISERKCLEEQLRQTQRMEGIGQLAGGIAHDFNNVLTAIVGYIELAQEELPKQTRAQEYLTNVQKAAERAATLTRQLLMYARRQMVEFHHVNLNEVILSLDTLLRRTIGEMYELVYGLREDL